jgi:hypothetical protein
MLHKQAVSPKLLELISNLMQVEAFNNFNLVGGTSLALQIGHRLSIDIDLFGASEINEIEFNEELSQLGTIHLLKKSKNILIYNLDGIKVDFVNYKYPLLEYPKTINSIRMVSLKDIGAMKLNAISGRGSRKDFIDLYFLLNYFSLRELLDFYNEKYADGSEFLVIKSLQYFEDAESEEFPEMIMPVGWEELKTKIRNEANKLI